MYGADACRIRRTATCSSRILHLIRYAGFNSLHSNQDPKVFVFAVSLDLDFALRMGKGLVHGFEKLFLVENIFASLYAALHEAGIIHNAYSAIYTAF